MIEQGWRTVVIENPAELLLRDGCMIIRGENEYSVPICQVRNLLIVTELGQISFPLMSELTGRDVEVVFCDKKRFPSACTMPLRSHNDCAGRIMDQSAWAAERKDAVWQGIVVCKIQRQRMLLQRLNLIVPDQLAVYETSVLPGDRTNREGAAARVYFGALFGADFVRGSADQTNAALNYGYTIICSAMARILSAYGYHCAIGIHHHSRSNSLNLACDLMEPFRPAVDEIVYANQGRDLDWAYKRELISILQSRWSLDGQNTELQAAMEQYALKIFREMDASAEYGAAQ